MNNATIADVQDRAPVLFMSSGMDGYHLAFAGDDYFEVIETFDHAADAFSAHLAATEAVDHLMRILGKAA